MLLSPAIMKSETAGKNIARYSTQPPTLLSRPTPMVKSFSPIRQSVFLGFDVFDLIGQDFKNLCVETLSDTSRAHISIRRVCPRGTTDQKISLKVNKQSTLYDICRSMNFVMTGTGIWNVPQEYVMKIERLAKSSDISYGVPKLRLRTFTGTYQNLLNSGLNQCVQVCAGFQK
jgi:hypothetical protein